MSTRKPQTQSRSVPDTGNVEGTFSSSLTQKRTNKTPVSDREKVFLNPVDSYLGFYSLQDTTWDPKFLLLLSKNGLSTFGVVLSTRYPPGEEGEVRLLGRGRTIVGRRSPCRVGNLLILSNQMSKRIKYQKPFIGTIHYLLVFRFDIYKRKITSTTVGFTHWLRPQG